jgi:hypothetical protein
MKNSSVVMPRGSGGISLFGVIFMTLAAHAFGQSATFTTQAYPLLGNTQIAADFNSDGKPDLAGSGLNAASIMLGNGDGTFRAKTDFSVGANSRCGCG